VARRRVPLSGAHRVATVGNAVFAVFLAVVLSHDRLFEPGPQARLPPDLRGVRAERVLLIVVDGLRADAAADEATMPALAGLRRRGGGALVSVESLIPSTIAGIAALTTGATAPPASVLQDLRALPADDGGVLAAVKVAGGGTFVAGPRVWEDRFGRWVERFQPLEHLVGSDDGPAVAAAAQALKSQGYRFLVVHLGGPDDAAHASGTRGPEYAAAVRAADDAIGRLVVHARARDLIVVTSDHGNTAAGGHAGPEQDVIRVPFIAAGPGAAEAARAIRRQTEFAPFAAEALGVALAAPPDSGSVRSVSSPCRLALSAVAVGCGLWVCASAASRGGTRLQPTLLNGAVWVALGLALVQWRWPAAGVLLLALLICAGSTHSSRIPVTLVAALAAGAALGALRLWDGTGPTWVGGAARNAGLAASAVAAALVGRRIGSYTRSAASPSGDGVGFAAGASLVVSAFACSRLAGQTLSLSTLDVRAGYGLAADPFTVPLAVLIIVIVHAIPVAALVIGLWPSANAIRGTTAGAFATGAGAVLLGQMLLAALVMGSTDAVVPSALALSCLLRVATEGLYVAMAIATLSVFGSRPAASPPGGLCRPASATRALGDHATA
jgi:hypothetical protein